MLYYIILFSEIDTAFMASDYYDFRLPLSYRQTFLI